MTTATIHRVEPMQDTPLSHINNARQVIHAILEERKIGEFALGLDAGLSAVNHRLKQAVDQLQTENAPMTAALAAIEGLKAERDALRDELREHQAFIETIEEVGYGHLWWQRNLFTIERRFRRVLGEYTDERLAMQHLKQLRAEEQKTTNQAATAAAETRSNG